MPSVHGTFALDQAQQQGQSGHIDPLTKGLVDAVDARMNDVVSGFDGAVNLGMGTAAFVAIGGLAAGGAVVGGMLARSAAPYDPHHISPSQEPSIHPAHETRMSGLEDTFAPAVATNPAIASLGLPERELTALAQIMQQHGQSFGGMEVSEKNLSYIAPAAYRDGAAERAVAPKNVALPD